jgi:hypothetical protein
MVLQARFSKSGDGQLRLYLVDASGSQRVAAVAMGLGVERKGGCELILAAAMELLDAQRVSEDHPSRTMDCESLRSRD